MGRDSTETRLRILSAAYALFYRRGFQRTSLDDIADEAGVTKRTLYYHVRSKDDLAGEMLSHQHAFVLAQVTKWIGAPEKSSPGRSSPATAMVDRLFAGVESWAGTRGPRNRWTGSGFTRIAMELADLPGHPARRAAQRHKAAIEAAFARRLAECGIAEPAATAAQLQILLEGTLVMILIHGETGYAKTAAAAARKLVRST